MKKLENKVAIVTGASKGIGASIAQHLAAEGAAVVVNYASSREGADRVVAGITKNGGKAVASQADVSRSDDVVRLVAEATEAFGPIDILVNNAGVYAFGSIEDVTVEEFHRQFSVNVLGLLLTTQSTLKAFSANGGSIINIGSVAGSARFPGASIYCATKAAVDSVTRSLASELGPRGIRVNAINPGMVETEGFHAAGIAESDMRRQIVAQTPLGRIGQPEDIGPLAAFLASSDAGWITGETFFVSGGHR